jgi:hypothetical protein
VNLLDCNIGRNTCRERTVTGIATYSTQGNKERSERDHKYNLFMRLKSKFPFYCIYVHERQKNLNGNSWHKMFADLHFIVIRTIIYTYYEKNIMLNFANCVCMRSLNTEVNVSGKIANSTSIFHLGCDQCKYEHQRTVNCGKEEYTCSIAD